MLIGLLLVSLASNGQDNVTLSVGGVSTSARQGAIDLGLKLFESYESVLNKPQVAAGHKWYMYAMPQAEIRYGSGDMFNGFVAKATGIIMFYDTTTVVGVSGVLDPSKMRWIVPYSVGLETNKDFKNYNVIGEIGLVPFYKTIAAHLGVTNKTLLQLSNQSNFGIYFQGGSKVGSLGTADTLTNQGVGDASQSLEKIDSGIARLKLMANLNPVLLKPIKGNFNLNLRFQATYWYDFINSGHYYRVEAKAGIQILKNIAFEFGYEKGSGAPNFNTGDQFGGNLKVKL